MTTEGAVDQASAAEPGTAGGGEQEAIDTQTDSTQGDEGNQGEQQLPPELAKKLEEKEKELLRGFHDKTQKLAEKERALQAEAERYKADANALYDLSKQEWFKSAVEDEKGRRRGRATEISAEQFEVLKNDPRAFSDFLSKRDQAVAASLKSQFAEEIEKLRKSQGELSTDREMERTAGKFGDDFKQANESKALEPYLEKGYDYETSYKLYCQDNGKVAGKKAAPAPPARSGAIEKGGLSSVRGGPVVEAASLDDALDRAFDLARRGVKEFSFKKK